MEQDRWRSAILAVVVVILLLDGATVVIGIKALHKFQSTTVQTTVPATRILVPSSGTTLSGVQALDASAVTSQVTGVNFLATGGTLHDTNIGIGHRTSYGWTTKWNTATVANGTYTLVSVGYLGNGLSARSFNIMVAVKN